LQLLKEIRIDCDAYTVMIRVQQVGGAACHTGHRSCFHLKVVDDRGATEIVGTPVFDPEEVYKK
ncbi:MAG: phosphoribosyl-AMP cyclohydrolase, partial [Desulfobacterales bacterium]|nr:phosphoribosyl-AMP cyclohydrolase [Desulfobacterales bacterium]